jgi:hypothetical protein
MTSGEVGHSITRRQRSWYLAGLVLALILPTIGMVLTAGIPLAVCYALAAAGWVTAYYFWIAPFVLRWMSQRAAVVTAALVLAALAVAVAVIHPMIDTAGFTILGFGVGAADNDNAVALGIEALLQGENPYDQQTFLEQPIGPLPGAFVLGAPFHLMGNVAFASIFFLGIYWFLAARETAAVGTLLLILTLTTSPAVIYQSLAGMDYTTDIMAVVALAVLSIFLGDRTIWLVVTTAAVGIAMATRINLTLLAIPLIAVLLNRYGTKQAITAGVALVAGFLAISVPFFLWDPEVFSPIQAGADKTAALPIGSFLIPALGLVVALMLARFLPHNDEVDFFRDAFWIQVTVIGLAIVSRFVADDPLASNYFTYAMLALYPGALFFWARLTAATETAGGKAVFATSQPESATQPSPHSANSPDDLVPGA